MVLPRFKVLACAVIQLFPTIGTADNSKYNLVPYEVIEKAITGDTAALLAVQERHKAYIGRLSGGNADLKERLNTKLLMAVLKFRLEYQPPSK